MIPRSSWPVLYRQNPRFVTIVASVLSFLLLACLFGLQGPQSVARIQPSGDASHDPDHQVDSDLELLAMRAAGNRTLGFHSIRFINLPSRFDRSDAAALQAYLAGVDLEDSPAVTPEQITDAGMPPSSGVELLKVGERACWRAHANIWSEILRKRLPPTLIIESDAAWDINLRSIMAIFNKHFTRFLRNERARPLYVTNLTNFVIPESSSAPWWLRGDRTTHTNEETTGAQPIPHEPEDPWHSDYWDVLSLGHCSDNMKTGGSGGHLKYPDPFAPLHGKDYFGEPLGAERVVHRSGGFVCTTAYAVTQRGVGKLLLRTALDLDEPVDLIIQSMIARGELVAYSVTPTIMAQWQYATGLGMELRGANSDIQGAAGEFGFGEGAAGPGWVDAWEARSVWTLKEHHREAGFRDMALRVAWRAMFGGQKNISVELDQR